MEAVVNHVMFVLGSAGTAFQVGVGTYLAYKYPESRRETIGLFSFLGAANLFVAIYYGNRIF